MLLTKYFQNPFTKVLSDYMRNYNNQESRTDVFYPKANITEKKDHFILGLDIPGVSKNDIDIEVKNHVLTVSGKRKNINQNSENHDSHIEAPFGAFQRSWNVENVDTRNIDASHENGVLSIKLPKKPEIVEKDEVKKIAIK